MVGTEGKLNRQRRRLFFFGRDVLLQCNARLALALALALALVLVCLTVWFACRSLAVARSRSPRIFEIGFSARPGQGG